MTESGRPSRIGVRATLAVGGLLIVGAGIYFGVEAFSGGSVYFRYVDELVRERGEIGDRRVKVAGALAGGSIQPLEGDAVRFVLERNGARLAMVAQAAELPEGFGAPGQDVIADGTLDPDGVFHATLVTTGCPSKYEARRDQPRDAPR